MSISKSELEYREKILKNKAYEEYELWISNFASNLNNIWNEQSASVLSTNSSVDVDNHAIVIGRGPSIKKKNHLKLLADSNFSGSIICCDGKLIDVLKAGITPDKFPNFYVVTVDPAINHVAFYDDPIVKKYGAGIKGIFSVVSDPNTVERARHSGIKIHWVHSLADLNEGKKSFNYITSIMVRAKNHPKGLPAIQTGANVGTSCWFIGWKILKCNKIALIGINHGWNADDSWDLILKELHDHTKPLDKSSASFKKLFPKLLNPDLNSYFILDPIFQLYRNVLLEFIERSPEWLMTYNATEGGSIFGNRVTTITLREFLNEAKINSN